MKRSRSLILGFATCVALAVHGQDAPSGRRFDLPVPVGHEVKGLRVPLRTNEGRLDMLFDMESATRLDQENIEMHTVVIQTYNQETSQPDVKIDLHTAVMNLDHNLLTSKERILVSRNDFELTGDGLQFNSKNRQGRVTGNVRMVIYNRAQLDKPGEKKEGPANPGVSSP
ncbi:MAG TPA: hypothetical protein VGD78_12225 [Chthoniobacterales bacterium]